MSAADTAPVPGIESRPAMRRSRGFFPIIGVALVGVLLVLYAWRLPPFHSATQSTDNAYVRGSVTLIAPKLDGYVAEVAVQDFQAVQPGQLLVRLDDRNYRQRLEQAQAQLAAQRANLANSAQTRGAAEANVAVNTAQIASANAALARARADLNRVETLVREGWAAPAQLDQSRAAMLQAQAAVQQAQAAQRASSQSVTSAEVGRGSLQAGVAGAEAAVQLAQIDLQNTRIVAPEAGQLSEVGVRLGQYVTPGTQLMSIVPNRVWVIANMKENQMARVRVGQPATLRIDALNGRRLRGTVERISPAAGSEFAVLRPDNATGNFTKVAQRIPVRIRIDPGQADTARLRPGMSVTASIDTAGG